MWLNRNHLEEEGLPVPPNDWTWDDFKYYAERLSRGPPHARERYGSIAVNWMHPNLLPAFSRLQDNPVITADGSSNFLHPAIRESLQLRYDLEQVHRTQFPVSEILAMQLDYRAIFLSGQASMMPMASNIIPQIGQTRQFPHNYVITFAPIPRPVGGNVGWTYHDNRLYSVGRTARHPWEAYQYLRWYTTAGVHLKNVGFPSERVFTASVRDMVFGMTSEAPHLFDFDALYNVMTWSGGFQNHWYNVPPHTSELLYSIFNPEAFRAIMGEQSIDTAISRIHSQAEVVIDRVRRTGR
jgi:multiple sugar transport system substrate-binding protein